MVAVVLAVGVNATPDAIVVFPCVAAADAVVASVFAVAPLDEVITKAKADVATSGAVAAIVPTLVRGASASIGRSVEAAVPSDTLAVVTGAVPVLELASFTGVNEAGAPVYTVEAVVLLAEPSFVVVTVDAAGDTEPAVVAPMVATSTAVVSTGAVAMLAPASFAVVDGTGLVSDTEEAVATLLVDPPAPSVIADNTRVALALATGAVLVPGLDSLADVDDAGARVDTVAAIVLAVVGSSVLSFVVASVEPKEDTLLVVVVPTVVVSTTVVSTVAVPLLEPASLAVDDGTGPTVMDAEEDKAVAAPLVDPPALSVVADGAELAVVLATGGAEPVLELDAAALAVNAGSVADPGKVVATLLVDASLPSVAAVVLVLVVTLPSVADATELANVIAAGGAVPVLELTTSAVVLPLSAATVLELILVALVDAIAVFDGEGANDDLLVYTTAQTCVVEDAVPVLALTALVDSGSTVLPVLLPLFVVICLSPVATIGVAVALTTIVTLPAGTHTPHVLAHAASMSISRPSTLTFSALLVQYGPSLIKKAHDVAKSRHSSSVSGSVVAGVVTEMALLLGQVVC